jgi:hypothetical protein
MMRLEDGRPRSYQNGLTKKGLHGKEQFLRMDSNGEIA